MFEAATRDEMDRLERVVNRVFARVSSLEARINELERALDLARATSRDGRGIDRPRLVEALGRTA